VHTILEI